MVSLLFILDRVEITPTIALLKDTCSGHWFQHIIKLLEHDDENIRQASANALSKLVAHGMLGLL